MRLQQNVTALKNNKTNNSITEAEARKIFKAAKTKKRRQSKPKCICFIIEFLQSDF
jgi:hypothetical protein